MQDGIVAYYRVSTARQGASGLGLDGQIAAVEAYAARLDAKVAAVYKEVETGKRSDRPELLKAIAHARRSGARLVIAKLDRLARDVEFISTIMNKGVDFVAVDNPHANRLTVHILAAVAEDEARRISDRTKAALAAYKAGGRVSRRVRAMHPDGVPAEIVEATAGKLGASLPQCRNLTPEGRARGVAASSARRKAAAFEAVADLAPMVLGLRAEGLTLQRIADQLSGDGHTTRMGKRWNPTQVMRMLRRYAQASHS